MLNASRKRSATCSWTPPARIAAVTRSSGPAPAGFAPTAGRARGAANFGAFAPRRLLTRNAVGDHRQIIHGKTLLRLRGNQRRDFFRAHGGEDSPEKRRRTSG